MRRPTVSGYAWVWALGLGFGSGRQAAALALVVLTAVHQREACALGYFIVHVANHHMRFAGMHARCTQYHNQGLC